MAPPFSPEESSRILQHLQQPAVFTNMTSDWPVLTWTAAHLSELLGDKLLRFRLGRKEETHTPLFETQCSYVEATLDQFLSWTQDQDQDRAGADVGPFCDFPASEFWAYADYKYIAMLFQDQPSMFEDVKWSQFGFEGRDGRQSTVWVGTAGANTPCHLDSYGCNLVLQVQGRKRWHLFPPEDTGHLYPTRIPYEESSVFSQVDVLHPDLSRFPGFHGARAHVVTLQPGQVLFVPRHWWHYVESVDPLTVSVNSWIEMEEDDVARVSEAVTKAVVCALKREDDTDEWLNPTEDGVTSHDDNMQCVSLAVRACSAQRQTGRLSPDLTEPGPGPVKRDSRGLVRTNKGSGSFRVPFGPHLIPVPCQPTTEPQVRPSRTRAADSEEDCSEQVSAVRTSDCNDGLTRARDCAAGTSESSSGDHQGPAQTIISTNDLLDCLLHPDIISRVTELLLDRHSGGQSGGTPR